MFMMQPGMVNECRVVINVLRYSKKQGCEVGAPIAMFYVEDEKDRMRIMRLLGANCADTLEAYKDDVMLCQYIEQEVTYKKTFSPGTWSNGLVDVYTITVPLHVWNNFMERYEACRWEE